MVVKNPFLSEKDLDIHFQVRDASIYRGIQNLFPNASLKTITKIAKICNEKNLLLGSTRLMPNQMKQNKIERGKVVTKATYTLQNELDSTITLSSYQNFLNISCELRILKKMVNKYGIHPYGYPLLLFDKQSDDINFDNNISWKCYFIDKLLFEDGDYFRTVLSMHEDGIDGESSKNLGIKMHDSVIDELKKRIKNQRISHVMSEYLREKIKKYEKQKTKKEAWRRAELDYTVRREWIHELGLLNDNNKVNLSESGKKLIEKIRDVDLTLDFFTGKIFSILSNVFDLDRIQVSLIEQLENTYPMVTKSNVRIIDTLILINSTILLNLPRFSGERIDYLQELKNKHLTGETHLVVESGYRTPDYYVKSRKKL